jgi:HK97 gp10 family phage protein
MQSVRINSTNLNNLLENVDIGYFADKITERAKELAPVDTGALRDSIKNYSIGRTYYVGCYVPYGWYMEFGTANISPRSFLRPALYTI